MLEAQTTNFHAQQKSTTLFQLHNPARYNHSSSDDSNTMYLVIATPSYTTHCTELHSKLLNYYKISKNNPKHDTKEIL
jgi:hypothetical protein